MSVQLVQIRALLDPKGHKAPLELTVQSLDLKACREI
jgi:hypothetical protein